MLKYLAELGPQASVLAECMLVGCIILYTTVVLRGLSQVRAPL